MNQYSNKNNPVGPYNQENGASEDVVANGELANNNALYLNAQKSTESKRKQIGKLQNAGKEEDPHPQPDDKVHPQRLLLNPQTREMQQKFTIDKQEYQSVFRVIDKDSTGQITIDQVNYFLDKFDNMHLQHQQRTYNEELEKQRLKERQEGQLQGRSGKNAKSFSNKKPQPGVNGASAQKDVGFQRKITQTQ